jgi:hypothetical protein
VNALDPMDPANRRITIVVMNKDAEARLTRGGGQIEIEDVEDLSKALSVPVPAQAPVTVAATNVDSGAAPAVEISPK